MEVGGGGGGGGWRLEAGGATIVGESGCGRPYRYGNAFHPLFIGVRRVSSLKKWVNCSCLASATRSRVVCQQVRTNDLNAERSVLPRFHRLRNLVRRQIGMVDATPVFIRPVRPIVLALVGTDWLVDVSPYPRTNIVSPSVSVLPSIAVESCVQTALSCLISSSLRVAGMPSRNLIRC